MSSNRILTRRSFGLDTRVWWIMILLIVLSGGLLGYKLMDKKECKSIEFNMLNQSGTDSAFFTGNLLLFKAVTPEKNITWDFNDNTGLKHGTIVTHQFANEGKYYVKVSVNSACETIHPVIIIKAIIRDSISENIFIIGQDRTLTKKPEKFNCSQPATSYEWSVLGHPELGISSDKTAIFTFLKEDTYTVTLTLNNNGLKKYTKNIKAKEIGIPPPPPPPPSKIQVNASKFKEMFQDVVNGRVFAGNFNQYLCSEGATPVIMNGKKENQMNLIQACGYLNGKRVSKNIIGIGHRAIKIDDVKLSRDDKNCVTMINVMYH